MITKRNTYRPHYFDDGSFMRGTMQTSIPIETAGINPQGVPNGNGTTPSGSGINWGNVGMGVAGAASGLVGQIGVSEKNPNGLWDAADPMHYLANGRTSKFGEGASKLGIGITQAGLQSGNPWLAVAGAAVKIVGDLGNAGWGHKTDEEQLARVNQGIDAGNNFQSNASSFDALQNPMVLAEAGNVYEGGWFNKKKWEKKNKELQANVAKTQANVYNQFNNNVSNLQQDQMNNMLANYAAFGGPLHTHGSDWTNGITYVDNGGSHESNPYGGVPMGVAQDGQPNLVEEGEVIYKLDGSPYVYSKRIKMSKELKDKYKFKGDTFADGALEAQKESEERPNDPISQRGLNAIMRDLANEQEKKRAEKVERQAKYAFGGHMFDKGSYLNEPGKLAYYDGRFYTLGDDGKWYSEDGKYYISNPSERKGMQFYTGKDFEVEEDWRERMSNPYPKQQAASTYTDPLDKIPAINPTGESYNDYVNRMHAEAERNAAWNKGTGTGVPLTDQMAGNPYYGTAPSPLQQNSGWRSFLLTPDSATTAPSAATTNVAPSTSTPTSKSTSTGKGTGTTGVKGNRAVDQANWADAKNWWLNTATDDDFNKINALFNNRFKDRNALAAYAESGNIGRAYNAISDAHANWIVDDLYNRQSQQTAKDMLTYNPYRASLEADINSGREAELNDELEQQLQNIKQENKQAGDVNNPVDNYKTWMRYAPIFGSGLALALDPWINRPDYTNADLVLEAGKSAGNVDFTPIGDYLPYKPYDRLFYANQLAANQAATRRALLNTTGGNAATARGLLLAADNQGINQMGNLWRQAEEYNEANRQAIAEFNRGTNMFNSEGRLKADMANQGQANLRINAAIEAAKLRALEDDRVAETRSANFTNFLDNLGDLGRENLYYNMVNNNKALYYGQNKKGESIYKGEGSTNNPVTMPMPIKQYTKTGKNGGYLTIKKKKK